MTGQSFGILFSDLRDYWEVRSVRISLTNRCAWDTVRLGEVCQLRFEIIPEQEFQEGDTQLLDRISFDEGKIFSGKHTTTKMIQYRAKPNDIVVSKINARKRAIGIVPEGHDIGITIHFRALIPDTSKIDTKFLWLALRNPFCTNQFDVETGGIGKGEISEERLLNIRVPFPPIDEQKRIVAAWQQAQDYKHRTTNKIEKLEEEVVVNALKSIGITLTPLNKRPKAFVNRWINLYRWGVEFNQWEWNLDNLLMCHKFPTQPLSVVADVNPSIVKTLNAKDKVTFVPMAAVSDEHGTIETPQERIYSEVKKGYTCFNNNDVIWAKITPCMENGKSAIAKNLINGYGFGSTEFHVIRSKDTQILMPEYIWVLLRLSHIRQAATRYFIGSAGQQRVPSDFLENLRIPVPPLEAQKEIVRRVEEGRRKIRKEQETAAQVKEESEREIERMILGIK